MAEVLPGCCGLAAAADILSRCARPPLQASRCMREGQILIDFHLACPGTLRSDAATGRCKVTVLAIDALPRHAEPCAEDGCTDLHGWRVSGYRAGDEVANAFGCYFNGLVITAAGKVPPASLHCRRRCGWSAGRSNGRHLGAIVRPTTRVPRVADQVTSLGGEFVKVDSRRRRAAAAAAAMPR